MIPKALRGRTVHEAIFNTASGSFRCPSSQQGYSPFSTWTRGLAWAMLGFAEELEFIRALPEKEFGARWRAQETRGSDDVGRGGPRDL